MAILVTKWFGVFLIDEKTKKILDKRLMSSDSHQTAEKLADIQRGSILQEERDLSNNIPKLNVSDRRQSELGKPILFDSSFITPDSFGFTDSNMREVMLILGKLRTSEPISRDKNIVQAIRTLDDTIETINLLNERIHEWYGMHFPELADIAKDENYALLISKHGNREGIIKELNLNLESIGADFDSEDMKMIINNSQRLCELYEDKKHLEIYVADIASDICPNMCTLLGGPLTARLISLSGGLHRLSSLPSSTVQLLGAEKAMFRHLRSGKQPPKHGIIYQHPAIHRSPYWQRGNIARALSGKILIAAKIDEYKGEFYGDTLKKDFETRVEEIQRKYPEPPKKPKNQQSNRRRSRNSRQKS